MIAVIQDLEHWAAEYEERNNETYPVGMRVPRVQIGAIRGGLPFSPSTGIDQCSTYVDVRVPPPVSFVEVERELKRVVALQVFPSEVHMYMTRNGYEGKNVEPLVQSIRNAHHAIRGNKCPPVFTPEISMWRDVNVFNEVGIPSATFGFSRKTAPGVAEKFVEVDDMVECAKRYALIALENCGVEKIF